MNLYGTYYKNSKIYEIYLVEKKGFYYLTNKDHSIIHEWFTHKNSILEFCKNHFEHFEFSSKSD
jgi:hypothetical protein